jgi:hypothetical protein
MGGRMIHLSGRLDRCLVWYGWTPRTAGDDRVVALAINRQPSCIPPLIYPLRDLNARPILEQLSVRVDQIVLDNIDGPERLLD